MLDRSSRLDSLLRSGRGAKRVNSFEVIRLDKKVTFYSRIESVRSYVEMIELQIEEGELSPDIHVLSMALNSQAWELMQSPVCGEA